MADANADADAGSGFIMMFFRVTTSSSKVPVKSFSAEAIGYGTPRHNLSPFRRHVMIVLSWEFLIDDRRWWRIKTDEWQRFRGISLSLDLERLIMMLQVSWTELGI